MYRGLANKLNVNSTAWFVPQACISLSADYTTLSFEHCSLVRPRAAVAATYMIQLPAAQYLIVCLSIEPVQLFI